ncbi:hypothetical protein TrVE_jg2813 [Triparma verrucosa]|uniref:Intraflagellar transport protein 46 homolog n=2 Tax=Triparma TaxID=722752 RepID=A0A9W7CCM8_9STRA|nr:hypothetical protein TrVE_jg2813 [Triparma verrucosa]GMI02176.1 hypothetical protein TrST_g14259 [Triparma strigata]
MSGSESDSDSLSDDSGFEESTEETKQGENAVLNQPFDEALDVSQSVDMSVDGGLAVNNKERMLKNEQFDEALDVSQSMDVTNTPMKVEAKGTPDKGPGGSADKFADKPFDEAVSMSDSDDSSVETNASPKTNRPGAAKQPSPMTAAATKEAQDHALKANLAAPSQRTHLSPTAGASAPQPTVNSSMEESQDESETEESSSDSEDDDASGAQLNVEGAYNPADYANLDVGGDIREIFDYISRYKPHEVELDTSLKCFIPDYIPAVGEMDAFIKIPQPSGNQDDLGLKVLDEPAATQSDATVLELQLRAISKKSSGEVSVRSIENASKNPQEIQRWISSINELHRSKPPQSVHYKKSMPDIEVLMDVWPEEFEDALTKDKIPLPDVNLDMSLEEYIKVWCSILDVPVYDGHIVESLHVLFTTYTEFLSNQHFVEPGAKDASPDDDFGSYTDMKY